MPGVGVITAAVAVPTKAVAALPDGVAVAAPLTVTVPILAVALTPVG